MISSSFGSVYFQWVLQRGSAANVGMWEKNVYLYFFGVILNVLFTMVYMKESPVDGPFFDALSDNWIIGGTIFLGACGGIAISLLLKYLDSAVKDFMGGIELFTVAIAQWPIMGIPMRPALVVSIVVVSLALRMYSTPNNAATESSSTSSVSGAGGAKGNGEDNGDEDIKAKDIVTGGAIA